MEYQDIIYEREGGKARIILNRPEKMNALTRVLQQELNRALWEADNDTAVHCVIIKGAGRTFSAGYDLTGAGGGQPPAGDQYAAVYRGRVKIDDDIWRLEEGQR